MNRWPHPPIQSRHLRGLRGTEGAAQPYFNKGAEETRFMREQRRDRRRKAAEENLSEAENLHLEKVMFGVGALERLKELALVVNAKQKVAVRRNPPVIHYTDGTTSLDRAKS